MNQSLINVANHSTDAKVLEIANFLLSIQNRRVRLTFRKKDGTLRPVTFVPGREYNETFGIRTTNIGRRIVARKCAVDMITIQEIIGEGEVQPRTINLRTVEGKIAVL